VKLHTVHEKKPTKELVGRKRKTAQEESKEHHPKAARGLGDPLSARERDLIIIGDEAVSSGLVQILLLEIRRHQAGHGVRSLALAHLVLLRTSLDAHRRLAHGGCVTKAIGNNEERKEITARRHKILTWKTLSNKER
jgi:hypothetical protein